ncbi:hypothetical protein [Paludisphaera borealis]|uniref:Uncharacterized protein n=1 Tax=Paludisphaera borealis TaxID=1387353 RepID=A0A1U7CME2_9BACT|nr:hypothetical protein [Paludisphaera borealis]APW60078.1 hypothetical protein BSF38_01540 [Paludisphaera borealis]
MLLVAAGLALLILGVFFLIRAPIMQAEQSIRDQILPLECRTAGFADAVGRAR